METAERWDVCALTGPRTWKQRKIALGEQAHNPGTRKTAGSKPQGRREGRSRERGKERQRQRQSKAGRREGDRDGGKERRERNWVGR